MEQEIAIAASAGIDYWAFGYEGLCERFRQPLRDALDAYLASPRKGQVRFSKLDDTRAPCADACTVTRIPTDHFRAAR